MGCCLSDLAPEMVADVSYDGRGNTEPELATRYTWRVIYDRIVRLLPSGPVLRIRALGESLYMEVYPLPHSYMYVCVYGLT
jgi:hypothetical protein